MSESFLSPEAEAVESLLAKKSLSSADEELLATHVRALLADQDGIEFLISKAGTKKRYRNRSALSAVIVAALDKAFSQRNERPAAPLVRLLREVARSSSVNEAPKWGAVRVLFRADGIAGRTTLGACLASITPKKELVAKFRKYAMNHLGADRGLSLIHI